MNALALCTRVTGGPAFYYSVTSCSSASAVQYRERRPPQAHASALRMSRCLASGCRPAQCAGMQ